MQMFRRAAHVTGEPGEPFESSSWAKATRKIASAMKDRPITTSDVEILSGEKWKPLDPPGEGTNVG
jgi:hypothetical protein